MHYYKFNIADYRKDTVHLTPMEHYIYRSLIDWYYLDELPIPIETHSVIRRLCLGIESVAELQNVLNDFFKLTDTGYIHKRIDVEINEYHGVNKVNTQNGKKGGRPPKPIAKRVKTHSVNSANPIESENNPNHKPLTKNQEPLTNNKDSVRIGPVFGIPDWIPPETWIDFVESRKKIRKPMTPGAVKLAILTLSNLRDEGNDPKAVLEQSIMNSYSGLFELKRGKQSVADQNRKVCEDFKAKLDQQIFGETYEQD